MSGSNPGLEYDDVPTAGEWNGFFSAKQDYSAVLAQIVAQGGAPSVVNPTPWTPTDASGATLTFTGISAEYTVIGNLALVSAQLTYPTTSDGSAALIGSLPYPVPNKGYAAAPETVWVSGAAAILMVPVINSSTAKFFALSSGSAVVNSTLSGKTITFQLAYPVS